LLPLLGCNLFAPVEEAARDVRSIPDVDAGVRDVGETADIVGDAPHVPDSSVDLPPEPVDMFTRADASDDGGDADVSMVPDTGADTDMQVPPECDDYAADARVAHWSLDQAGIDGTYPNLRMQSDVGALSPLGGPSPTAGIQAGAVSFDGDDDALVFEHASSLELGQGTISFWFRDADPSNPDYRSPFGKDAEGFGDGGHIQFYVQDSNLQLRLQDLNEAHRIMYGPIQPDTWYHVIGSFGPAGLALYVDGVKEVTDPHSGGIHDAAAGLANEEPGVIGASTGISGAGEYTPLTGFFQGAVDDVVVFDRQLSDTEASELHALCAP
jgi:hypothetical protein